MAGSVRTDVLDGPEGVLEASVLQADWPYGTSRTSTAGSGPEGRGARMAIPQHLIFAAENIQLPAGETKSWTLRLEVRGGHAK
jgi:hypothetical protein